MLLVNALKINYFNVKLFFQRRRKDEASTASDKSRPDWQNRKVWQSRSGCGSGQTEIRFLEQRPPRVQLPDQSDLQE
jgi:hypothetical protein